MDALAFLAVVVLLAAIVFYVTAPLRATGRATALAEVERALRRREELEAQRTQRLAELRDLDLDHRTGKLDDADFEADDARLRAEAVAILRELDELDAVGEPDAGREDVEVR